MVKFVKKYLKIILLFCLVALMLFLIFADQNSSSEEVVSRPVVVLDGRVEVEVEIADTDAKREKGLSGKPFLLENEGMLFEFDKPDQYGFWMPNMNFPIDIIWIKDGKIVEIDENVSNDFDPENPIIYYPKIAADRVLEVNSGFVKEKGLQVGDVVAF